MTHQYDLIEAPWIPVIGPDGHQAQVGLQTALIQAHEWRELGGESPLVVAALYRLLLAVLQRIYGAAGYEAWGTLWQARSFGERQVGDYLAHWRERFDLFHPQRPFYQAADERVKPKSVSSMVHDVASGNNATLFDHHTDADRICVTAAEAARLLVAAQAYGLAGLSGLPQKFTDGTCSRGVLFLVQGDTLFETLMLNLLPYSDSDPMPRRAGDCPAWEMDDPFSPDRGIPFGYLDYLTWQNRRILLIPEEGDVGPVVCRMTMGPGLRLDAACLDPMKHYRRDEKRGALPLRFSEERALWRDSAALLSRHNPAFQPPRVYDWLAELAGEGYLRVEQTRRTLALGMANDQAKVEFYRSERWPLPLAYLEQPELVDALSTAIRMAEDVARQLWGAARTLATLLLSPEADQENGRQPMREDLDAIMGPWGIERGYWSRLELPFRQAMESVPQDPDQALAAWQATLRRTAHQAFEHVADAVGVDVRALKAVVRAGDQLAAGLAKVLPSV